MRNARSTWLGIGLVILLGTGAVTLSRAQQAGEKRVAAPMARAESRERVLKLRAEIDVVQVEFDAARATLLESLKRAGAGDREETKELSEIRGAFDIVKMGLTMHGVELTKEKIGEIVSRSKLLGGAKFSDDDEKLLRNWLKEGPQSLAAVDQMAKLELKERTEALQLAVDRQRKDFSRIARKLSELKLDLDEAEKQYQREAR